ncbi:two-component system, NtrC family, C4-dicarboxylate transport response regulator DctD [Salinihabitans flavidus]|uniref:Nif-specific regulatory protein n=1 Tax=Salinihabitans flavidus TaxID=569882 RepID=A0A1H8MX32_9RHOB|nr:sigma-54 dependent transcriptional regulator [Salinihabitans flavidus]SEO21803.1 two-component system, NtrC family, C4-dicarboxylate transport response regulator DctD [Salinihabitans flavidus]
MTGGTGLRALIVDDDKAMRASLCELLEAAGWQVEATARAASVAELLPPLAPDVILSDMRMPGMSGMELLASLDRATAPPVVLISAHGDIPMAVEAMQNGAYSFVEKPCDPRRLLSILRNAAERHRMARDRDRLKARLARLSGLDRVLLGQTSDIRTLREDVLALAETDTPVLVTGETGTGKELVARALHDLSPRAGKPFVALNCATLPDTRFEAGMFGVKGETTGTLTASDGGTLFLDEICACPEPAQAKLLRVIETREIWPIGAHAPVKVDFRLVCASNEDPERAVAEGRLRADLLYRLNTMQLALPPLRARREDLALLFRHFLDLHARTHEIAPPDPGPEDIAALMAHNWPGNVRELRHVAERRVLAARRGRGSVLEAIRADTAFSEVPDTLREAVAAFERELIAKAIQAHRGRMDAVAEALGIGRRTLNEKIVKLDLDKDALL